ncbi:cytochrome P450 [Mycobacterium sp. URHB0021]|jgi:cytochrome P450
MISRDPHPLTAFGCGEHSCIEAQLARLEARIFFEVLLGQYPELELVGDVDRMRATMVPCVKRMPVRIGTGY